MWVRTGPNLDQHWTITGLKNRLNLGKKSERNGKLKRDYTENILKLNLPGLYIQISSALHFFIYYITLCTILDDMCNINQYMQYRT